jgi:hypothetical protein
MDPLGRVVLVRGPADTVWVVSVASDKVLGTVESEWRADLPLVLPDGQIALAHGTSVIIANDQTFATARTIANGARDFWHVLRWNGFRPRSAALDEPVEFRTGSGSGDSSRNSNKSAPPDTSNAATTSDRGRDSSRAGTDTSGSTLCNSRRCSPSALRAMPHPS